MAIAQLLLAVTILHSNFESQTISSYQSLINGCIMLYITNPLLIVITAWLYCRTGGFKRVFPIVLPNGWSTTEVPKLSGFDLRVCPRIANISER